MCISVTLGFIILFVILNKNLTFIYFFEVKSNLIAHKLIAPINGA